MSEGAPPTATIDELRSAAVEEAAGIWWLFLFTGSLWLLFSIIVFRFDWTTVSSISILFGIAMIGAAGTELLAARASHGWWKAARLVLATAFAVIAIVAFVHPGDTFEALGAVISFYFIIKGGFEIIHALAGRHELDLWWLNLLGGIALLLLGFWAAGDFGHSTILLVVWVGVTALTRGISEIVFAFEVRGLANAR
jgi:uncharacterized membrane protein HdeD (DUF308 family)